MSVHIDPLVRFLWLIANSEANYAGDSRIRPLHFLIALLKLPDDSVIRLLKESKTEDDILQHLKKVGRDICGYLEMDKDRVKILRRRVRKDIHNSTKDRSDIQMLHRSEEARELFHSAQKKAESLNCEKLNSLHLLEALFMDGYVSIDPDGGVTFINKP